MQNKYSPREAAKFLNITEEVLSRLTKERKIRQHQFRDERFYLGGELDVAKMDLANTEQTVYGSHETVDEYDDKAEIST